MINTKHEKKLVKILLQKLYSQNKHQVIICVIWITFVLANIDYALWNDYFSDAAAFIQPYYLSTKIHYLSKKKNTIFGTMKNTRTLKN